ncbi:MAG TPA: class I SAM-dependent methyltransferase [Thermoanaerobaculia bacterium]
MSDRYEGFDYSRLISWGPRLEREWPFLDSVLRDVSPARLLDLGSGTGEHARFLASHGFSVVGIDSSSTMIERARASTKEESVEFIDGDMTDAAPTAGRGFGAALCLGNALPHLLSDDEIRRFATSARDVIVPGGPLVIQLLNYDRIEAKKERALPLTFLRDPDDPAATIIFLRAMELREGGRLIFMPTMLKMKSEAEPPIEVVSSRRVEIRGWRRHELEAALRTAGFGFVESWGGYDRSPFVAEESRDVILVAR